MLSRILTSLAASTLLLSQSFGQTVIRVDRLVNGSWVQFGSTHANGSSFTIADTDGSTYQVYSVPLQASDAAIGTITITSSGSLAPAVLVGQDVIPPYEPTEQNRLFVEGAVTLGGITWSGGKPKLQAYVSGNITGEVHMYHIVRIDALGDIQGKISHEPGSTSPPALGRVYANAFTGATTAVYSKYGNIGIVEATGGNIEGDISSVYGSITNHVSAFGDIQCHVLAPFGSIGDILAGGNFHFRGGVAPFAPVTIRAKNGIHRVFAGYDIYANITANDNGGTGAIANIQNTYTGTLKGSIVASTLGTDLANYSAMNFAGDVDADIALTGGFDGDGTYSNAISCRTATFHSGRTFSIGGSLGSTGSIFFIDSGISGQIIINANNTSSSWSGNVSIGDASPYLLDGPYYSYTSTFIGGGAVGQAPFNFHAVDCLPPHNSTSTIATFPTPVIIRHYGPVFWTGSGSPVQIFARIGTGTYTDYTSDFKVTPVTGNNHRDLQIVQKAGATLGWAAGYNYKIVPITNLSDSNALRCLDVTGKPAVAAYEYKFTITP